MIVEKSPLKFTSNLPTLKRDFGDSVRFLQARRSLSGDGAASPAAAVVYCVMISCSIKIKPHVVVSLLLVRWMLLVLKRGAAAAVAKEQLL